MSSIDSQNTTFQLEPSLKWAMGIACLLGILAVSSTNMIIDLDLFHQMALFREMLATGAMPMTDSFAYTPTRDVVVHHEWGMGAIQYFAMVGSGMGNAGLIALKYFLTFSICFACYRVARVNGASFSIIIMMAPVALVVGGLIGFTNVRAQVVTLLFLAIQFWMFASDDAGRRTWILFWIPMMIAWTNIHGGVVAGAAIFAFWVGCRFVEGWFDHGFTIAIREGIHRIGLAISLPALMCINPYGTEYLPYLIRAVRMKRPMIGEWSSIWGSGDFSMLLMFSVAIFLVVVAVTMIIQKESDRRSLLKLAFPVLAIALTWIMASKHMRHVSIFGVTWMCYAPALFARTELHKSIQQSVANNKSKFVKISFAVAMLALAMSLNARFWAVNIPAVAEDGQPGAPVYPVRAIDYLEKQGISGNMMVWFNHGAYVSWRMFPKIKVSLDSRYEAAYPDGAVEESVAFFYAEENWQETLKKYPTDLVLVPGVMPIRDAMISAIEEGSLSWKIQYQDESFTVFRKLRDDIAVK